MFGLIERRSQHLVFGEFSSKFADAAARAPLPRRAVDAEERAGHGADRESPRRASTSTPSRTTRRRPVWPCRSGGSKAPTRVRSSRSTPPPPPEGCCSTPRRPTSTTSPRRSASPPTAASGWPPARRRPSSGSSGSGRRTGGCRPRSTSASPSTTPASTRPTTRRRWPRSSSPCSRSSGSTTRAGSAGRPSRCDRSAEAIYGWAEASDFATPFVADPAAPQPRRRHHRPRRPRRGHRGLRRPAGQRHRRHRELPQARPQPAPRRPVPGHRARRRRRPHELHRPRRLRHELTRRFRDLGPARCRPYVPESAATTGARASTFGAWTTW